MPKQKKIAVILQNLGGPDSLEAVKPFLYQLFSDKAIIGLPWPLRQLLAHFIASKREKEAQAIYGHMGGKSPIVPQTVVQAQALEQMLNNKQQAVQFKTFIAMRYWHPFTEEAIALVKAYQPDEILLLPLYPQFSTTTAGSSYQRFLQLWDKTVDKSGDVSIKSICCYYKHPQFIKAHVTLLREILASLSKNDLPHVRLLFSAHGLPQKIVDKGDPYQYQVEQTVSAVIEQLARPELEHLVCYQSKVGPMQWLLPATDAEILKAAQENKIIIVIPIAFVSEHSETLVELDIEYKKLAMEHGARDYKRVPALADHPDFIKALSQMCLDVCHLEGEGIYPQSDACGQVCGKNYGQCPCFKLV